MPALPRQNLLYTSAVIFFLLAAFLFPKIIQAQDLPKGVAENLQVADQEIQGGHIVAQTAQGIVRANENYQAKMFGVAVESPIIVVHEKTENTRAISTSGEARVQVNAKNGGIKVGDFVTSSDIPGVGVKAREPGYVLGIAQSAFLPEIETVGTSNEVGEVIVTINIHFTAKSDKELGNVIVRIFKAFTTSLEDQSKIAQTIRYFVGAFLALIIFIASVFLFARSLKSSIDAMGRNPLARTSIQFGMLVNFFLAAIFSLVGLAVAFVVIRL